MAMTLTGMATVRPVRMAVLMISVSCREQRKAGLLADHCSPRTTSQGPSTPQLCILPVGPPGHKCRGVSTQPYTFSDVLLAWTPAAAFTV